MTANRSSKIGDDEQQHRSTETQCGYGQFQVLKAALRKPNGPTVVTSIKVNVMQIR